MKLLKNKFINKKMLLATIAAIFIISVMVGGEKRIVKQETVSVPFKDFKIIK